MPFVLVTSRLKVDKSTRSDERIAQTKGLLMVGGAVLRLLEPRFSVDSFRLWSSLPEGESSVIGEGVRKVSSTDVEGVWRATDDSITPPFVNPLGIQDGVRMHHILELRGSFRFPAVDTVPASLTLNLSPAWSETQGDIEFETYDTAERPNAGLAELLRSDRKAAEPFIRQFMHGLSRANDGRLPIKIRWAAIQATEGAFENRDFLSVYRHYETTLRPLLSVALEDRIREEFKDILRPVRADRPLAVSAAEAVVKDLVKEMGETREFDSALGSLQARFGVEAAEVGSVIFTSWEEGSIDRMASYVITELGAADVRTALATRLGLVDKWGKKFARIAAGGPGAKRHRLS